MRILTGMQASGIPHIGNYFGMIKPALELQSSEDNDCYYFIADLHAFTSHPSPEVFRSNQKRVVLDWLALGLDPEKSVFYRQSDIRAHSELTWYLLCHTPMGMLERAHSYKDKKARGMDANAGLFTYPILMAADILLYGAQKVPVGKDQKQHVEMARDIAQKINHQYGDVFVLPEALIRKNVEVVIGLDGQKMSKSYGNTIEIFEEEKSLKKKIMSLETESVPLGSPMNTETCRVLSFHRLFQNPQVPELEKQYKEGSIGFGESKKQLFEYIWNYFEPARKKRNEILKDPNYIESVLKKGAEKARKESEQKLQEVRKAFGLDASIL